MKKMESSPLPICWMLPEERTEPTLQDAPLQIFLFLLVSCHRIYYGSNLFQPDWQNAQCVDGEPLCPLQKVFSQSPVGFTLLHGDCPDGASLGRLLSVLPCSIFFIQYINIQNYFIHLIFLSSLSLLKYNLHEIRELSICPFHSWHPLCLKGGWHIAVT